MAAAAAAQTPPRIATYAGPPDLRSIWILQPDNKLLMYDTAQFRYWRGYTLPAEARKNPEAVLCFIKITDAISSDYAL